MAHAHDPRISSIKQELEGRSLMDTDGFKAVFCEKLGVTLSKIFTSHEFHRNRVEGTISDTLELSLTLQFKAPNAESNQG